MQKFLEQSTGNLSMRPNEAGIVKFLQFFCEL
jgi:hypothetical protein